MKNINIQWVTQDPTLFELDWLKEVLGIYGTGAYIDVVNSFQEWVNKHNIVLLRSWPWTV